jgi:hypothetical protein
LLHLRNIFVVLLLLVVTLNIASCDKIKKISISGKYLSEKNPLEYRELKSNGLFYVQVTGGGFTGPYIIEGNQITFLFPNAITKISTLTGNTIVDNDDGLRFTKVK